MKTADRPRHQPAPKTGGTTTGWRPWVEAGKVLVVTRLVFLEVAFAANWFISWLHGQRPFGLLMMWLKWDAVPFVLIAQHGYTSALSYPHSTAFFPFVPLMLRALMAVGIPSHAAGLVIAAVSSLVAFAYLYRLAEEDLGERCGRRAVLYLALFPSAVFLIAGYTEPVFLAGAIPAFYYARRARWHLVALPAAVAVATRFAGIFLLLGLAVEFLRQREFSPAKVVRATVALAGGALPLVAYGFFLHRVRGDAFYYFTDQRLGWRRYLVNPVTALVESTQHSGFFLEALSAAVGIFFIAWAIRKQEWGYATYMGASLAALMTSSFYQSIPRVLVSFFPIMLLLADHTHRHPDRHWKLVLSIASLATIGVVAFTRGLGFY